MKKRGFGLKVFLVVVAVAVVTTGVTAAMVTWRIGEATEDTVETEKSIVKDVADSLHEHATTHASWTDIDAIAKKLSDKSHDRILLTTVDGAVVTDTAKIQGEPVNPSTSQPVLLKPTIEPELQIELEQAVESEPENDPASLEAFSVGPDELVDVIAADRGDLREAICQDTLMAQGKGDSETERECKGALEATAGETREDYAAVERCDKAVKAPKMEEISDEDWLASCRYQVVDQRISDFSPEPLLLYMGTEKPFQISFPTFQLTLVAVAVLALVVAVSALLSRRVIRPVGSLIRASRELSAGNLNAEVTIRGHDQFAELGGTFNGMVDSLRRAEQQRRQLIADSAHELRTPLANIHGYLEAIDDGVMHASPDNIASLREESHLLRRIVDDLRVLALSDADQMPYDRVAVDVDDLLRSCRTAHAAAAELAGVNLTVEVPGPVTVHADPDRLRQALGNLVSNAMRATPPGGEIVLRAFNSDGRSVIEVADTGGGIAPEHLSKVFDRFWRADPSRGRGTGGSGLGLAITREVVAAHGGDITVRNGEHGAIFAISLPSG